MLNKFKTTWILGIACFAFILGLFWPAWQAYLQLENTVILQFDPAAHVLDGIRLYQQLIAVDSPSFVLQLLNVGFWLPFHPLLLALVSFFFRYQLHPLVFVNYLLFS